MTSQNGSIHEGERLASARVTEDAVSIQKMPERREDGFVITYTIDSFATEPVAVSFDDEFDFVDSDDIGFHGEHAPASWQINSEVVSVDHIVAPNEESYLLMGIVTGDRSTPISAVQSQPKITNVETVIETVVTDGSGDVANGRSDPRLYERAKKSLMAGESESSSERSDLEFESVDLDSEQTPTPESDCTRPDISSLESSDEGRTADSSVANVDIDAESETLDVEFDSSNREPTNNSTPSHESDTTGESVFSTLISEIESENVPEGELDVLRDHLSVDTPRSEEIRLEHVQSRLDDLAAYVAMFEQFIDERGTLREVVDETDTAIESQRAELDRMGETVDEIRTEQNATKRELESLQDRLEHQETTFTDEIEALEDRQETAENKVDRFTTDVESDLAEIRTQLERFEELSTALESVFQTESADSLAEL